MSWIPFAPTDAEVFTQLYVFARMNEDTGSVLESIANLVHLIREDKDPEQTRQYMAHLETEVHNAQQANLEHVLLVRRILNSRKRESAAVSPTNTPPLIP